MILTNNNLMVKNKKTLEEKYNKVLERARRGQQKYRDKNREHVNELAKKYYYEKKEVITPEEKEKKLEQIKKWQQEHKENRRASARKYYETHKEQKAAYSRKHYQEHKEEKQRYQEEWREKNPEKYQAIIERTNKRHKESGLLDKRILFNGKRIQVDSKPRTGKCSMCGKQGRTEIHHIKYHDNDPLKDTIEVCAKCHREREQKYGEWRKKK